MISIELLSKVMNNKCLLIDSNQPKKDIYKYKYTNYAYEADKCEKINIYKLANKCEEWCDKNNWYILSYYQLQEGFALPCENGETEQKEWFVAENKPEAIFKATQYILDNKDKK